MKTLVVGTRGSKLALRQTELFIEAFSAKFPNVAIQSRIIKTKGDKILDHPLAKIDDKGLFTKEIESALASGEIDAAVHSLKDLPTDETSGLTLAAIFPREDPHDMLITPGGVSLEKLATGSRIGTGSPRRVAQIAIARPDCRCVDIRGNVETRLRKLSESGDYDAIILARAGLSRLGLLDERMRMLEFDRFLPAPGQGAMAVQCRDDDEDALEMIGRLNDANTRAAVTAERAFLKFTEGGCQVPLGALAQVIESELVMDGILATDDGSYTLRHKLTGSPFAAQELGERMGREILARDVDRRLFK
jgi:hydroxymethylbilane synthase